MTGKDQNDDGAGVTRRQALLGAGGFVSACGLSGVGVAGAKETEGPFLTKIKETTHTGYVGGVSRTMGTETRRFLLPDLELTPIPIKQKQFRGVSGLIERGVMPGRGIWYDPLSDQDTYVVTHEDGEQVDPVEATPATFEVPEIDESEYDAPVLGLRIVGTMSWEPARNDVPLFQAASGELDPNPADAERDGPTPTRVEYQLFKETRTLPVDSSWNCVPNNDQTNLTEQMFHRIVTGAEPGLEYEFDIDCTRPPAWFDIDLQVEVVLDKPRPTYGNENGFANSNEATFEANKMTSIEDLAGYSMRVDVETAGIESYDGLSATLQMTFHGFYSGANSCARSVSLATGTEGIQGNLISPQLYSWAVRPESGVTEWEITTTMYKQVVPGEGNYTHPYRRPPKFGIFNR